MNDQLFPSGNSAGSNPSDHPAAPDRVPDQNPINVENESPAVVRQHQPVPDGWLTRTEAQERLSLAGIEVDSRRIRHLCSRNELENVKAKNEKNQPQYFINPASIAAHIEKNRPANQSGIVPDKPTIDPDHVPYQNPTNGANADPVHPAKSVDRPDKLPDDRPTQTGAGELVPKAQLDQALETIDFLKEEIRDSRQLKRDLKEISSEMLDTFSQVATGRQLPVREPSPRPEPIHMDVPDNSDRGGV